MKNEVDEIYLLKKALELSGEDLEEIYNLLSPVEQAIVGVLITESSALSVKEIRNKIIDYLTSYFTGRYFEPGYTPIENLKKEKFVIHPLLRATHGVFEHEKIESELEQKLKGVKSPTERRKIAEKILKSNRVAEIPSFQTIEKILTELVAQGLVIRRKPIMATKTKFVYAVNPKLLKKIDYDIKGELENQPRQGLFK